MAEDGNCLSYSVEEPTEVLVGGRQVRGFRGVTIRNKNLTGDQVTENMQVEWGEREREFLVQKGGKEKNEG